MFIYAISRYVPTNSNTWLINTRASPHIICSCEHLSNLKEKDTRLQVITDDDACYSMKDAISTSFQLVSGVPLHLSDVLFVPRKKGI